LIARQSNVSWLVIKVINFGCDNAPVCTYIVFLFDCGQPAKTIECPYSITPYLELINKIITALLLYVEANCASKKNQQENSGLLKSQQSLSQKSLSQKGSTPKLIIISPKKGCFCLGVVYISPQESKIKKKVTLGFLFCLISG
jgi:hypothetical protein